MSDFVANMKGIVGQENVLTADMAPYLLGNEQPAVVVFPGSTEEVVAIVKMANEANLKINVGGKVVDAKGLQGGIAMAMSRMNAIVELDHANLTCYVQAGMNHQEFVEKMAAEKLYFPPEPFAVSTSSIAGCFAVGDIDSKSFNYMPTRTYILGYEMVLPTGEVMTVGNKCIKNVSGYDMIHFVVGARGTLGILTKVLVKLLPLHQDAVAVVAELPTMAAAAKAFKAIQKRRIFPSRMNALSKALAEEIRPTNGVLVVVDLEGFSKSCNQYAKEIQGELQFAGATATEIITDQAAYQQLWAKWLAVREKVNANESQVKFTVGPANAPQAVASLKGIVGDLEGGAGVLLESLIGKFTVMGGLSQAAAINKMAMALGGNVSGLLGSKLRCQAYNDAEMEQEILGLLNSVRSQFDPKGTIAPGIQF